MLCHLSTTNATCSHWRLQEAALTSCPAPSLLCHLSTTYATCSHRHLQVAALKSGNTAHADLEAARAEAVAAHAVAAEANKRAQVRRLLFMQEQESSTTWLFDTLLLVKSMACVHWKFCK
jgi:hypothetical protein